MLDLGTGPFCVLALIAATAGAKKVYAVEANPEAARRAKAFIAKCEDPNASRRDVDGLVPLKPGLIEVIEGFSTELTLPEKVDLCVFEICGSWRHGRHGRRGRRHVQRHGVAHGACGKDTSVHCASSRTAA